MKPNYVLYVLSWLFADICNDETVVRTLLRYFTLKYFMLIEQWSLQCDVKSGLSGEKYWRSLKSQPRDSACEAKTHFALALGSQNFTFEIFFFQIFFAVVSVLFV